MELSKSQKTFKFFIYCVIILIAHLIQNTSGLSVEIDGVRCFFLIPTVICLSIEEDERTSALLGLFAGLLWDSCSLSHNGFNCIFLMLACFIASSLETYIIRSNFITVNVFSVVFSLLYSILYWLFFIIIKGVDGAESSIATFYIPCAIYTIIVGFIIYPIIREIKKKLMKEKRK